MRIKTFIITVLLISTITILFNSCKKDISSGAEVIESMYEKWHQEWPQHMIFEQKTEFFQNDSIISTEVWNEYISSPGYLHVRFNGFESGNGLIFRNDSMYSFINDELFEGIK